MSARRQTAGRSRVREWATVTVAFPPLAMRRRAMGLPTIMLRPMTTASLPEVSTPEA